MAYLLPPQTPAFIRASYTMETGAFLGLKRSERGVNHPPHI